MNWEDLGSGGLTTEILRHWRKLGQFRRAHPAVGAGAHRQLQAEPYVFSRTLTVEGRVDRVVVALDQGGGAKTIPVLDVFPEGTVLEDAYSGVRGTVRNGAIALTTASGTVLLAERRDEAWGTESVVVYVTNHYALPMEVYAVGSGISYRMGVVNPGMDGRFTLRAAMLASGDQVEFQAAPSGYGRRVRSERVQVAPGDVVDFEIATNLIGTRAVVRP
jgi:hypothetical protein